MKKRYHVTHGAYTTVGGTVFASGNFPMLIDGKPLALEGDPVSCIKCLRVGYILCRGPRVEAKVGGKLPALEGDYCICGCMPPPQLMANQSLSYQTVDDDDDRAHDRVAPASVPSRVPSADTGRHFRFLDSETQQPLSNRRYVGRVNGRPVTGSTDHDGLAHIDAPANATIEVHLIFTSPKDTLRYQEG